MSLLLFLIHEETYPAGLSLSLALFVFFRRDRKPLCTLISIHIGICTGYTQNVPDVSASSPRTSDRSFASLIIYRRYSPISTSSRLSSPFCPGLPFRRSFIPASRRVLGNSAYISRCYERMAMFSLPKKFTPPPPSLARNSLSCRTRLSREIVERDPVPFPPPFCPSLSSFRLCF